MGRRDKSPSSSNRWADGKESLPKCKNTYRHGEWRCEVEQYQKFSSDEIGSPSVDLQSTIASPPPILLPVYAWSMTTYRVLLRHCHGSTGCGSAHSPPYPCLSCFTFQMLEQRISWRILPIPPAPALLDEFLIEIHAIGQDHLPNGGRVRVHAVGLDGDFFASPPPSLSPVCTPLTGLFDSFR